MLSRMLVDGVELEIPDFDSTEISSVVGPLTDSMVSAAAGLPAACRLLVGVCGPPGSGKTIFALRWIRFMLDHQPGLSGCVLHVPMDGYHLPNSFLDEEFYEGSMYPGRKGRPLREIKGAPETFDVESLVHDLQACSSSKDCPSIPVYDRRIHDPEPGRIFVGPGVDRVIFDGNYLAMEEGRWSEVGDLLHLIISLQCPVEECTRNLLARHRRGGKSEAEAEEHVKVVDRINHDRTRASEARAHFLVQLEDHRAVRLRTKRPDP